MLPLVEVHENECRLLPLNAMTFPDHIHEHLELIYVAAGETCLMVEQQRYELSAGDAALVLPGTLHAYEQMGESVKGVICLYRTQDAHEMDLSACRLADPILRKDAQSKAVRLGLHELYVGMDSMSASVQKAWSHLLTELFLQQMPTQQREDGAPSDVLYAALRYLSAHYDESISLETVSRELGVSSFRLSRLFSNRLNMGFRPYLNALRVARARQLLLGTSRSVTEICYECGFENLRTFDRAFVQHSGTPPRAFRTAARERA